MPIIVSGKLRVKSGCRDEFIERSIPSIKLARETDTCNDFSVSIDPIDPNRVNVYEIWVSRKALEGFRNSGTEDDLISLVEVFDVSEYEISEEHMKQQPQSTLDVIYENWRTYHEKLRDCIAPLTNEQLLLQPAAHMWPLGQIVQHIVSVRAGWFSGTLQENDEAMNDYMEWGQRDSPARSAAELARGLDETWAFIEARLQRWTPEDCAKTFLDEWDGQVYEVSRSWVIYHVLEHDLHHGGEVSLILGMNGLRPIDL